MMRTGPDSPVAAQAPEHRVSPPRARHPCVPATRARVRARRRSLLLPRASTRSLRAVVIPAPFFLRCTVATIVRVGLFADIGRHGAYTADTESTEQPERIEAPEPDASETDREHVCADV